MKKLKEKRRATLRTQMFRAIFYFLPIIAILFLFPHPAHAEGVYSILKSDTGIGGSVQQIWKGLLTVVNSLIIALLIFVAFAEMLRININTYGVKKILPTLIFAIIAANFSYILVRFIVDIANVSMTFISSISNGNGMLKGSANSIFTLGKQLKWDPSASWYTQFFPSFMQWVIVTIEAILLLCLAFLFIARNWMIYALAITSPIAIMAIVLPQTKKYFTQWWDYLIKWTFMPLVSFLFLALANKFTDLIQVNDFGFNFNIMPYVFVGFCLYMAITMPFKLGGPVMQSFYKMTGAKFTVDKTKEYAKTRLQKTGLRAWNNWQQLGLDTQRGDNKLGRTIIGNALGKAWIGNALIKAKADLSHEDDRSKGLVEGITARHYQDKGDKHVGELGYNANRQGEIKEYQAYAFLDMVERGKKARAEGKESKVYEQMIKWRLGSGVAQQKMAAAADIETAMRSDGVTSAIEGRLVDKSSDNEHKVKEAEDALEARKGQDDYKAIMAKIKETKESAEYDALETEEEKEALLKPLTAQAKTLIKPETDAVKKAKDVTKDAWLKKMRLSEDEVSSMQGMMRYAVTEKLGSEELMNKAQSDMITKSSMQIAAIHELVEMNEEIKETARLFKELPETLQRAVKKIKNKEDLDDTEKQAVAAGGDKYATYKSTKARAETLLLHHAMIESGEHFVGDETVVNADGSVVAGSGTEDALIKRATDRQTRYADKLKKKLTKNGKVEIPLYLQEQLEIGAEGELIMKKLQRTTFTRFNGKAMEKMKGRVPGYAAMQVEDLLSILENGDKKDNISAEESQAFGNGDEVMDPNHASRLSAATLAVATKLSSSVTASETAQGLLTNIFSDKKIENVAQQWIAKQAPKMNGRKPDDPALVKFTNFQNGLRLLDLAVQSHAISPDDAKKQKNELLLNYYDSVESNIRQDLTGVLIKELPEAHH